MLINRINFKYYRIIMVIKTDEMHM